MKNRKPPFSRSCITSERRRTLCVFRRCKMSCSNAVWSGPWTETGVLFQSTQMGTFNTPSIGTTLSVSSYVTSNPVSQLLGTHIGEFFDHFLVVIKVVSELLTVFFNQTDCSNFDKTRTDVSHNQASSYNLTSIGISGSS